MALPVHPVAALAVAGLAMAGFKLYASLSQAARMVKRSLERYNDEKVRYYTSRKAVLETVLGYGQFKLAFWADCVRLPQLYARMKNPPGVVSCKGVENVHAGRPQMADIQQLAKVLEELHVLRWDEPGTGLLVRVAACGRMLTRPVGKDQVLHLEGFPDTPAGERVLEILAKNAPPPHSASGFLEENALLDALLGVPAVVDTETLLRELSAKPLSDLTQEEAFALRDQIDWRSLKVADAVGRLNRLAETVTGLPNDMVRLGEVYKRKLEQLELRVMQEPDYQAWTPGEQQDYQLMVVLQRAIRRLSRLDLVLERGNLRVLNAQGIQECRQQAAELVPLPDPEAKNARNW